MSKAKENSSTVLETSGDDKIKDHKKAMSVSDTDSGLIKGDHKEHVEKKQKKADRVMYATGKSDMLKKLLMREIIRSSRTVRVVIYVIVLVLCGAIFWGGYYIGRMHEVKFAIDQAEIERSQRMAQFDNAHMQEITAVQDLIATDGWKEFKSQWYGFVIKHPSDWLVRTVPATQERNKAIYRVGFYKPQDGVFDASVSNGYEVAVYDLKKVPEFTLTDEYPVKRENVSADVSCETIGGHLYETGDYPAEEVYVPEGDQCFEPALFYSNVVGQYIYTIAPIVEGNEITRDPMVAATDHVPEFFAAASQFANIDIVRPKPKPAVPRVNAPMPATYKKDALGRLVCAKKNDKPSKSKENNKGKIHLDMECCLDPDEYPNPHCYYDPGKYGKYLNKNIPPR